jgi:hypothetical protein
MRINTFGWQRPVQVATANIGLKQKFLNFPEFAIEKFRRGNKV